MPRKAKGHIELIEDALVEYTDNKDFILNDVNETDSRKTFVISVIIDDSIVQDKGLAGIIRGYDGRFIPNAILCERYLEETKIKVLKSLKRFGYVEYKSIISFFSLKIYVIYAKGSSKYKL